ncbi:MAG: DNA mismatch repair protein [Halobacteriales archaeon]
MRLEAYWGVGPKSKATLESSLGTAEAVEAIESGDLGRLVDAGLAESRAARIIRRARSEAGMALLSTPDARNVYKQVIELAADHAVNRTAAGQIRTLTPLLDRDEIADRLDAVERGRRTWAGLDESTRAAMLDAFEPADGVEDRSLAAVETAVALRETGATGPAFEPVDRLDVEALSAAATALRALSGDRVRAGADDELDRLRDGRAAIDTMVANREAVVSDLRSGGAGDASAFRDEFVDRVRTETGVDAARIRANLADDAVDAPAFVGESLRALRADLDATVDQRAATVRERLEADVDAAAEDVTRAEGAVRRVARELSLGRFAEAYDLRRPTFLDRDALAVEDARNLTLVARGEDVQPVTYALGNHDLDAPSGDRVAVLTGANSGGKTTLLETVAQVAVLAHMGLPVPADRAAVSLTDRLVFHRRHASFNAGVLESTLRSVVPPLVSGERTLMLVDEFEAITEPGRAADLLHGLVELTVEEDALGTFVTHLADELEPLPVAARTDGIYAEGLTDDLALRVDYQPRFGEVGRSTPEFIVSRLVAGADDRAERAGFRTLAEAIGDEAVQRTLSDVAWDGGG